MDSYFTQYVEPASGYVKASEKDGDETKAR
jgi:hypothetical protein